MQVICTDGTVLQCGRFEAIDSGVLLFDEGQGRQEADEDEAEDEEEEEATAFVPLHQLRIVLPDGAQPGRVGGQTMGQTTPRPPTQAPPTGGGMPPQGQMPPQQTQGGQQGQQGGAPGQGTGPGQGRR